ncbi:MAG: MFS transporter [Dehalococcoidia bacterium]
MARGRDEGLWRNPSFRLLWLGQASAIAGGQIRLVVLPVLMFQLTGSATQTALVLTVQLAPYLVFGLVAGAVADRANRRAIMIAADLTCAGAMASIPAAAMWGTLTPAQIYVAGTVTGTAFVWHDSALFGALPTIVGRQRVAAAYGVFVSTSQFLQVVATAVAGVLIAAIGAQNALWIDAASYAVSAVTIALVPAALRRAAAPGRPARLVTEIAEGLRYVRRHPVIWPLTSAGLGAGLVNGAVTGLVVVYGVRQLGLPDDDVRLGWLFTALAAGGLVAGLALPLLSRRVNPPRLTLLGLSAMVVLLVALSPTSLLVGGLVLLTAWGAASTLVIANGIALRQQLAPDRLQGRVNVTARMIAAGGIPAGSAIGGLLADQTSVPTALAVMTVGMALTAAYAWSSPLRRIEAGTIARMAEEADRAP